MSCPIRYLNFSTSDKYVICNVFGHLKKSKELKHTLIRSKKKIAMVCTLGWRYLLLGRNVLMIFPGPISFGRRFDIIYFQQNIMGKKLSRVGFIPPPPAKTVFLLESSLSHTKIPRISSKNSEDFLNFSPWHN